MTRPLNLSGQRFGRLVAIKPTGERKNRALVWLCQCDCGNAIETISLSLRASRAKSCGCSHLGRARHLTHGHSRNGKPTPEYISWTEMKRRCHDPRRKDYKFYGARGIRVCQEWLDSFEAFLAHIGPRPGPGYTVDRIKNSKGYEPGNVRWATAQEQHSNRGK